VAELNPQNYFGICVVRPAKGDRYTLKLSVSGNGSGRSLKFDSSQRGLVPDEVRVVETVRFGNKWIQERLELGDGQYKLFGSMQWNVGEPEGQLNIWEPNAGYGPLKYLLVGKCQLEFGGMP